MGEVYRAEDTQLRRTVAIKRLARRQRDPSLSNTELLREARRASVLNHPRVASIYDVFTVGDELFLVMEYIDGSTLRERLQSPLSVNEFCRIAIQCADALSAAHQKGIVHGDLKPSNIMLTRDSGDVKVCDFGLARRLPKTAPEAETTSTATPRHCGDPRVHGSGGGPRGAPGRALGCLLAGRCVLRDARRPEPVPGRQLDCDDRSDPRLVA